MENKNIFILPTDRPTWLHKSLLSGILRKSSACIGDMKQAQGMNIYITSNEEIKEGDWCLDEDGLKKCTAHAGAMNHYFEKIILTTDQDLINDGVQAIDDEFLEWFVKNPSCDEVEVGYGRIRLTETDNKGYWVAIPNAEFNMQEEKPKQEKSEDKFQSWDELIKEVGGEKELLRILKLPHIAPLVREAMRSNCKNK